MVKPSGIKPFTDDGTVQAVRRLSRAAIGEQKPPAPQPFVKVMRAVHEENTNSQSSHIVDIKV